MAFWGVEVKPKKPFTLKFSDFQAPRLHLSQATLGNKKLEERVIVKCTVGDTSAIYVCSLLPGVVETCSLDLYFDDDVTFSVKGPSSVHLVGYYDGTFDGDQPGEDVEDDGYSDEEDEDYSSLDGFINDDSEEEEDCLYDDEWSSEDEDTIRVPNSGVTIEEVIDDVPDKPANQLSLVPKKATVEKHKKEQANRLSNVAVLSSEEVKAQEADKPASSSEDEDGFHLNWKRKPNGLDNERPYKKKSSKMDDKSTEPASAAVVSHETPSADAKVSKKKKKKKKIVSASNASPMEQSNCVADTVETPVKQDKADKKDNIEQKSESKKLESSANGQNFNKKGTVRKYPNGLEVENTAMGKPDGKQVTGGKKVGMIYTGKLKSSDKIFDSNVGKKPFFFRLGVGEVIKGWDIGVNGMRVGDKRHLTIPPAMGYGSKGVNGIPPNSWLVFDVELVDVK